MNSISQAIVELLREEMFYGEIISQMQRKIDYTLPAVAGVCIKDRIELHINPYGYEIQGQKIPGFNDLTLQERVAVLKHECDHILQDHIPRAKEICPAMFKKQDDAAESIINNMKFRGFNMAADCSINGNHKNLPEWAVFPEKFDLKNGETMEWYLERLKDNEKAKNFMELDGHSLWKESGDQDKDTLKEKIRQAINKAAERTRDAGKMTSSDELLVSNFNKNLVNWKEQMKRFVAKTVESVLESSRKKRNRRYGISVPGYVKIEDLHIGVAIDTSGSVSDESLKQFMSEIQNIAKYAKVTVVEADSEIKNVYEFKPKKEYVLSGRGGTAYQPAFDYFNGVKDIDGVIYFGDMDSSDVPEKPKYSVLWAIVGSQNPPVTWGSKIYIGKDMK